MYAPSVRYYHENTSDCAGTVVNQSGKCSTCGEQAYITGSANISDSNVTTLPYGRNLVHITVVRTPEVVEEELAFAEKPDVPSPRKSFYKAPLIPIKEAWRTRWRPTQQRPRDGLR